MSGIRRKFVEPKNEIWVDDTGATISLTDALTQAPTGYTVRVFSGSYADIGITITNAINVLFDGKVGWTGTDTLFTIGADGTVFTGTLLNGTSLISSHASNILYDPNGKDYSMKGLLLQGKDLFLCENGCDVMFNSMKLYTSGSAGARVTGGYFRSEQKFQMGEPVNLDPTTDIYGLKVSGGTAHFRGGCNVYVDVVDQCIEITGGSVVIYDAAICGHLGGGKDAECVLVTSGSFSAYAGEFANQSNANRTIAYGASGSGFLRFIKAENTGTSNAISSHNDATVEIYRSMFKTAGATAANYGSGTTQTDNTSIEV